MAKKKKKERTLDEFDIDNLRDRRVDSSREHIGYHTRGTLEDIRRLRPWAQRSVLNIRPGGPLPLELEKSQ